MVESGKTFSSLIFWKHGAVNEFYGAIHISFQMRRTEFPVTAVWKSRSCQNGNLYVNKNATCDFKISFTCELCDNDSKQSNYRLMNVKFIKV